MADNFLEKHFEEYEARKAAYLRKKKHLPKIKKPSIQRPDDEALEVKAPISSFMKSGLSVSHQYSKVHLTFRVMNDQ